MDQEIENFLLEKLKKGLEPIERKSTKIAVLGRLSPKIAFLNRIRKLETLIQEKLKSDTRDEKSIRDCLYALNNVLIECQTLSNMDIHACFQIKGSLDKIEKDLTGKDLTGSHGQDPGDNGNPQVNTEESSLNGEDSFLQVSGQSQDLQKFKEFEDEITLLESLVQKESAKQFRAIAVVGRGGVGKTTLCRLFFNKEAEKETRKPYEEESAQNIPPPTKEQKYCPRIWVSMSRQLDEDEDHKVAIGKRMLDQLGVDDETIKSAASDLSEIIGLLHQQLWGKKYLIVLDNVCGDEKWYYDLGSCLDHGGNWGELLAYGFPKGYGGTVIVTSRNEESAMRMVGEENLHRMMPPAKDKICWSILQDSAKKDPSPFDSSNAEQLKAEVYSKCAGIPLAAKIMIEIMNKQLQEESANIANSQ